MANTHLPIVNQKLMNAGALLDLAGACLYPVNRLGNVALRALLESAVFQLDAAFILYLRELGETYGLKQVAGISSLDGLIQALQQAGKSPGETQELTQLLSAKNSWLSQLLVSSANNLASPAPVREAKAFPEAEAIALIDITQVAEVLKPDLGAIEVWLQSFKALVVRQRDTSSEY